MRAAVLVTALLSSSMSQPCRVAILECDKPVDAVRQSFGTYGEIFERFLTGGNSTRGGSSEALQLDVSRWDVVERQQYPGVDDIDAILLSGSKHTAFDDDPWILRLVDFVRGFLSQAGKSVVGICFGHQIVARALGASVSRSFEGWEVAVSSIDLNEKGRQLLGLERLYLHQMHRDLVLEVPKGLFDLGSSPQCPIQALYQPGRILTFQAHPEFNSVIMSRILEARHQGGVFDKDVFENGIARANLSHDGQSVSSAIIRFLASTRTH